MMNLASRLLLVAALGLGATACASPRQQAEDAIVNPLERYPLTVKPTVDDTRLAVHAGGVSPNQRAALVQLRDRWRDNSGEAIVLRAPQGGAWGGTGLAMAEQAQAFLISQGVAPEAVRVDGYDATQDPAAPLIVSFRAYEAEVPQCGKQWDSLTATQSNGNWGNFGCATAANMAAQIAYPSDIVGGHAMQPGDASRRATVMDLYRKGESTSTKPDQAASGAVSQAIP
jgi:pilus assembly protein CpaD